MLNNQSVHALRHMVLGGWKLDEDGGDKMIAKRNRMIIAKLWSIFDFYSEWMLCFGSQFLACFSFESMCSCSLVPSGEWPILHQEHDYQEQ